MAVPRTKVVSEANQGDLIIDVLSDLIITDVQKNPKMKISADEAIDMRGRFHKLEQITEMWYELRESEGKGIN